MSTVTIVTRTKDRPVLLARAIRSVLGQTLGDWKHIIVNDGGDRDRVEEQVATHQAAYRDRVRILHQEATIGMQQAANAGIAADQSPYICIHDDDDSWAPAYLAAAVAFLEDKGPKSPYQGVIAHTELIEESVDADGQIEIRNRRPYIPLDEISLFRIGFENPFPPIAFCFRRSAYEAIDPFDPRFNVAGDYDFNFRFLRKFEIGVLADTLAFYHIRVDPRNEAEGNSVALAAREHKVRYNELKNHYLRQAGDDSDAALALAFNTARYLVEIEWVTHETREHTRSLQNTLEGSVEALHKALAPEATRAYRENLLEHLNALSQRSEQHAANLWKDLNARTRETTAAIAKLETALTERHDRLRQTLQSATEGVGQEATLQTLLSSLGEWSKDLGQSNHNLWTDLNARARETIAAIEAHSKQHAQDLLALQSAQESATARQAQDRAEMRQQLTESSRVQTQFRAFMEDTLAGITAALADASGQITALQDAIERDRASRRSLFSLGRLGLFWKRRQKATKDAVSPEI